MPIVWPREDVLSACKKYAPLLPPIGDVEPALLLAALAMNESSLGQNCGPRHEPAWDVDGVYAKDPLQARLLQLFPYSAACSFGPLQVMFYNCNGFTPNELNSDLSMAMRAGIGYLSKQVRRFNLATVEAVGQCWNQGHPDTPLETIPDGVKMYCRDLQGNYIEAASWMEGIQ